MSDVRKFLWSAVIGGGVGLFGLPVGQTIGAVLVLVAFFNAIADRDKDVDG